MSDAAQLYVLTEYLRRIFVCCLRTRFSYDWICDAPTDLSRMTYSIYIIIYIYQVYIYIITIYGPANKKRLIRASPRFLLGRYIQTTLGITSYLV